MQEMTTAKTKRTHKKALVAALCGMLVLTAGSGAAMAAGDTVQQDDGNVFISQLTGQAIGTPKLMLTHENGGAVRYSNDGGETWIDGVPEDLCLIQNIDGVTQHSTDGGVTWIEGMPENMPEGLPQQPDKGAVLSIQSEGMLPLGQSVMIRNTDGMTEYSIDGGETWTEGLPEGMPDFTTQALPGEPLLINGSILNGEPGMGVGLAARTVDGVTEYSLDGGQTWTQEPPAGVDVLQSEDGSVSIRMGRP